MAHICKECGKEGDRVGDPYEELNLQFMQCLQIECRDRGQVWVTCKGSCNKPQKYNPFDPNDRKQLKKHLQRSKKKPNLHMGVAILPDNFIYEIPPSVFKEEEEEEDSDSEVTVVLEPDFDDATDTDEESDKNERVREILLEFACELQCTGSVVEGEADEFGHVVEDPKLVTLEKPNAISVAEEAQGHQQQVSRSDSPQLHTSETGKSMTSEFVHAAKRPKHSTTETTTPKDFTETLHREASKTFFGNTPNSIKALAWRANQGASSHRSCTDLTDSDTAKFFLIMKTVTMMPKKGRNHLAIILKLFQDTNIAQRQCLWRFFNNEPNYMRYFEKEMSIPFLTRRINAVKDLRNLVWDGRNCFLELLPHPRAEVIGRKGCNDRDSFVYISVIESIAHILRWDNLPEFDDIKNAPISTNGMVTHLSQSKFGRDAFDNDVDYHFMLTTWQDGFQANYSSKKERLKPWIKTGTLEVRNKFLSKDSLPTIWKTTFPIAFGLEKGDKTLVEQKFFEECKILDQKGGNIFLYGEGRRKVRVRVTLVALKGDQPERRNMCGLIGINGNYGPAFGVIGNFKEMKEVLPSCDMCLNKLMNKQPFHSPCDKCLNWDALIDESKLNEYEVKFSSWPPGEQRIFKAHRVSFKELCRVVDKAHNKLLSADWSKMQADNFLTAHALSKETVKNVIDCAVGCILKERAETGLVQGDDAEEVLKWIEREPHKFQKFECPAIWTSGIEMYQVPCIIMHLLFLGISKWVLGQIKIWLAASRKQSAFERSHVGVLDGIKKLDLPWCRALPYLEGTGGAWVSENYLAFARLMPWIYSQVHLVKASKELPPLPEYDIHNKKCYNSQQCQQWLEERGIEVPKGAAARQNLVYQYLTSDSIPDPMSTDIQIIHAMLVVQACTAMIARLMVDAVNEEIINDADRFVRIFLSYVHRFDKLMTQNQNNINPVPQWIAKANFLSLPRVIEAMRVFGPLRLLFEGGVNGEGILKYIKPFLSSGYRDQWHVNCMVRLLRVIAIAVMEGNNEIRDELAKLMMTSGTDIGGHSNYRIYRGLAKLIAPFRDNQPISGFLTDTNKFGACVRYKGATKMYRMRIGQFRKEINCMAYHSWSIDFESPLDMALIQVKSHVLFLPEMSEYGYETSQRAIGSYTAIDDHWNVLNSQGIMGLPQVEKWPLDEGISAADEQKVHEVI